MREPCHNNITLDLYNPSITLYFLVTISPSGRLSLDISMVSGYRHLQSWCQLADSSLFYLSVPLYSILYFILSSFLYSSLYPSPLYTYTCLYSAFLILRKHRPRWEISGLCFLFPSSGPRFRSFRWASYRLGISSFFSFSFSSQFPPLNYCWQNAANFLVGKNKRKFQKRLR